MLQLFRMFRKCGRIRQSGKNTLRRPPRRHWHLEALEDRANPSSLVLTVNSLADGPVDFSDSTVTLREAITAANTNVQVSPNGPSGGPGADTIEFDSSLFSGGLQTITLDSALPDIAEDLTITGPGAKQLAISGNNSYRVLQISSGTVAISGLTIKNGNAGYAPGSGILNAGTLTLTNSAVTGNNGNGLGGAGIQNSGTMTLHNCTVSGNTALFTPGAGIRNLGTLTLINSTVSGNFGVTGSGIYNNPPATLTLTNSTVSGNQTGIESRGVINIKNSIVSGNQTRDFSSFGRLNNLGNNVLSGDPKLGPLQDNGGPTQTMLPLIGSPALNAGDNSVITTTLFGNPVTDQRGQPRIIGNTVDIGAAEAEPPSTSLTVDENSDVNDGNFGPGKVSLREAIILANAFPDANTIAFAPTMAGQTVILSAILPTLSSPLTITGPGSRQLALSGNNTVQIFRVQAGATVAISGLTIKDGSSPDFGGGIFNQGSLTLAECFVFGNFADRGGAIFNQGTLTLRNSTVAGNYANRFGGGIHNTGTLDLTNSTMAGNFADSFGGAINNNGTAILTSSTIAGNNAPNAGGIQNNAALSVRNTIVAGNRVGNIAGVGTLTRLGKNLLAGDPKLGPLADNGGPTLTRAPLTGSPAINMGDRTGISTASDGEPATDQRGLLRIYGTTVDIGAVEVQAPTLSATLDQLGNLVIKDQSLQGINNRLTVQSDGTNLIISDAAAMFTATTIPGATRSNDNRTLTIPLTASIRSVSIDGNLGSDSIVFSAAGTTLGNRSLSVQGETLKVSGSVTTSNKEMTLSANNLSIDSGLNAGVATVTLKQQTARTRIALGGSDGNGALGLTDAELDQITAGTLAIGDANTGGIRFEQNIDRSLNSTTAIQLTTGAGTNIDLGTFSLNAQNGNVTLTTSGNGAILTSDSVGTDINGADVSLNAGSGGIGTDANAVRLQATTLTSVTSGNGNQHLAEIDQVIWKASSAGLGTIALHDGTFLADLAKTITARTFEVRDQATLGGKGVINGSVTVKAGGSLSPGFSAGAMASGAIKYENNSSYLVEINGAAPGNGYDFHRVIGDVTLTGATLQVSGSYVANGTERFVILSYTGNRIGTFQGLPPNSTVQLNNRALAVVYDDVRKQVYLTLSGS